MTSLLSAHPADLDVAKVLLIAVAFRMPIYTFLVSACTLADAIHQIAILFAVNEGMYVRFTAGEQTFSGASSIYTFSLTWIPRGNKSKYYGCPHM